jgi:PAS domain S-box-containing protein
MRSLFDVSPDPIYILSTRGEIIQTNRAAVKKSGYGEQELLGNAIYSLFTPSSQNIFEKHFPILMELGLCNVEVEFVSKDGSISVMDCAAVAIYNGEGNVSSLMVAQRDVTERIGWAKEREKLILDLQVALDKVKTLRGLIPICSSCKKVRDDKGYWQQVESYVSEHTLAEFSHGICPDCFKKLYPHYNNEDEA